MRRVTIAILVTLVVNVLGLGLLVRIHARTRAVDPPVTPPETAFVLMSVPAPVPPRETPPPEQVRRRDPRERAPLPVPSLPSAIQARDLVRPDLDTRALIQPLFDADPADVLDFSKLVMTSETVDEPPRVTRRVPPDYPVAAETMGLSGEVVVKMLVDRKGRVQEAMVESSDHPGVFDEQSLRAVRRWRFDPAIYKGHAVTSWCRTRLIFTLDEGR